MELNRWIVTYAKLRDVPGGNLLCEMPFGSLVHATGEIREIVYSGQSTTWAEVIYQTGLKEYHGWVYDEFVEAYDLNNHFPKVDISNQTLSPQDAAQYMIMFNQVQFNLCGELCISYLMGVSLDDLLLGWEPHSPSVFKRIFYGGKSRVTGIPDLNDMLIIFDVPTPALTLPDGLRDPLLERALITPARMERLLEMHQAIVSVKIESTFGRLKPSGIGHWVVLNTVYPHGVNGGMVEIYNPFSNLMEGYSWAEFVTSMSAPLGLWVARR